MFGRSRNHEQSPVANTQRVGAAVTELARKGFAGVDELVGTETGRTRVRGVWAHIDSTPKTGGARRLFAGLTADGARYVEAYVAPGGAPGQAHYDIFSAGMAAEQPQLMRTTARDVDPGFREPTLRYTDEAGAETTLVLKSAAGTKASEYRATAPDGSRQDVALFPMTVVQGLGDFDMDALRVSELDDGRARGLNVTTEAQARAAHNARMAARDIDDIGI